MLARRHAKCQAATPVPGWWVCPAAHTPRFARGVATVQTRALVAIAGRRVGGSGPLRVLDGGGPRTRRARPAIRLAIQVTFAGRTRRARRRAAPRRRHPCRVCPPPPAGRRAGPQTPTTLARGLLWLALCVPTGRLCSLRERLARGLWPRAGAGPAGPACGPCGPARDTPRSAPGVAGGAAPTHRTTKSGTSGPWGRRLAQPLVVWYSFCGEQVSRGGSRVHPPGFRPPYP